MLANVICFGTIALAVIGAVTYLVRHHRVAKKSGGCTCVGCSKCGGGNCSVSPER